METYLYFSICLDHYAFNSHCIIYAKIKFSPSHITLWQLLIFSPLGGINFLNNVYPIITSPYSGITPSKPSSGNYFIKSLWSSLIGIWRINLCVIITSLVIWYFKLTCSFVKVWLTTWVWLHIQLCNLSIFILSFSFRLFFSLFLSMIFHAI